MEEVHQYLQSTVEPLKEPQQLLWMENKEFFQQQPYQLLFYADKNIVKIMDMYIEWKNLQVELMQYRKF